jgi:hypothetical protein
VYPGRDPHRGEDTESRERKPWGDETAWQHGGEPVVREMAMLSAELLEESVAEDMRKTSTNTFGGRGERLLRGLRTSCGWTGRGEPSGSV